MLLQLKKKAKHTHHKTKIIAPEGRFQWFLQELPFLAKFCFAEVHTLQAAFKKEGGRTRVIPRESKYKDQTLRLPSHPITTSPFQKYGIKKQFKEKKKSRCQTPQV